MPKEIAEKDVQYGAVVLDELPADDRENRSQIRELVDGVAADVKAGKVKPGQPVVIATYAQPTAASAQANILRKRLGPDAKANGFTFVTRWVKDGDEDRKALIVQFDPGKIVAEETKKQAAAYEAYKADQKRKRDEKAAKAAKAGKAA